MQDRSITSFIDTEIKAYSISVIESRAIPSIIDGMKPVQRKIIYTADKMAKTYVKTAALVGSTINIGGYYMGDASIEAAIGKMTQSFTGANNVPLLEGEGAFGSRLVPEGIAASRYTKTKISGNFYKLFGDTQLLNYEEQDGEYFEPKYYHPVIPTVLLNKVSGIAVGFACEIQPYKLRDIINNMKAILSGKKPKKILPFYDGFTGTISEDATGDIIMTGVWKQVDSTHIEISEIPVGISREKYVEFLMKLEEMEIINDFTDYSKKEFKFVVELPKGELKKLINENKIPEVFRLSCRLTQNLNLISEDKKLLQFTDPNEIISYFIDFRMSLLSKKKSYWVKSYTDSIVSIENKISFIKYILSGKIVLDNCKSRKGLLKAITDMGFKEPDSLGAMPIYNINQEAIDGLEAEIKELKSGIDYYNNTSEADLFVIDLEKIKG